MWAVARQWDGAGFGATAAVLPHTRSQVASWNDSMWKHIGHCGRQLVGGASMGWWLGLRRYNAMGPMASDLDGDHCMVRGSDLKIEVTYVGPHVKVQPIGPRVWSL